MRRITRSAMSIVALLAVAGCGDTPTASAEDCSGPPTVNLVDPGAEPRHTLELSPVVGDTVALDMLTTTETSMRVNGDDVPSEGAAPVLMGMEVTVEDVTDDEIELSFVYDKVETDDQGMRLVLDSMVGLSGTLTTTRNGAYVEGDIDTTDVDPMFANALGQFEQLLADMTVPLPTEPVGDSAEWEVASAVEASGITFCYAATYRLVGFDGDAYELEVDVSQRALGTEDDDASITVTEGSGSATGTTSGRLSLPLAVSATSSASTTMTMETEHDGEQHTHEVTMDMDVEISLRDNDG